MCEPFESSVHLYSMLPHENVSRTKEPPNSDKTSCISVVI